MDIQADKHTETRSVENEGRDMRRDSIKVGETIQIKVKNGLVEDNIRETQKKNWVKVIDELTSWFAAFNIIWKD